MCGIAGVHRLTDRPFPRFDAFVDELLVGIEHRGKHATGFAAITDKGNVVHQRASCEASKFVKGRRSIPEHARSVILHTRWATQGDPAFPENNHPVRSGDYYVVHNGHIWSDGDVFRVAPFKRVGEVDSEAIAAVLRMKGWTDALEDGLDLLDGNMAFAAINRSAPGELILAKGWDSPLYVARSAHLLVWASTIESIRKAWGKVLGTPPKNIRFLKPGVALVVRKGDVNEVEFKLGYGGWSSHGGRDTSSSTGTTVSNDAARIVQQAIEQTTGITRIPAGREGMSGGRVYAGGQWRDATNEELDSLNDDTLARTYAYHAKPDDAEEGEPALVRCDDCMEWTPVDSIHVSHAFGTVNMLCDDCHDWAVEAGVVIADR